MSRIALTTLLAVGMLVGSAGVAVASSALSTDTNAAAIQYGSTTPQPANLGQSAGDNSQPGPSGVQGSGGSGPGGGGAGPDAGQVLNAQSGPQTAAAQAPRQVDAQRSSELPFTGYAAIPILLIGLLLLGSGLLLRHRNAAHAIRP